MGIFCLVMLVMGAIAVACFVIPFVILLVMHWFGDNEPIERSRDEVIQILRTAAEGRSDFYVWDDFVSVPIRDPDSDRIRELCFNEFWNSYTFTEEDDLALFSNPAARERLNQMIAELQTPRGAHK